MKTYMTNVTTTARSWSIAGASSKAKRIAAIPNTSPIYTFSMTYEGGRASEYVCFDTRILHGVLLIPSIAYCSISRRRKHRLLHGSFKIKNVTGWS